MRSTGRRGVRQSFSTPRTSTYTLRFEGNASLFVPTGAVRYQRDKPAMRTDASAVTGKTAMQRHVFSSLCRRAALAALFGFVASSALATGAGNEGRHNRELIAVTGMGW